MSAVLFLDLILCQSCLLVSSWISLTLFATNYFNSWGFELIHANVIIESILEKSLLNVTSNSVTLLINLTNNKGPHNSRRGNDCVFNGANRDFVHNKRVWMNYSFKYMFWCINNYMLILMHHRIHVTHLLYIFSQKTHIFLYWYCLWMSNFLCIA